MDKNQNEYDIFEKLLFPTGILENKGKLYSNRNQLTIVKICTI
jgi:hypothetical protein